MPGGRYFFRIQWGKEWYLLMGKEDKTSGSEIKAEKIQSGMLGGLKYWGK